MPLSGGKSKRIIRYAAAAAILLCAYTLIGIGLLPYGVQRVTADRLSGLLNRQVAISRVEINPFNLTVRIFGLSIRDTDGQPFVSADEIAVNGQVLSLFKGGAVLERLHVVRPAVRVVRSGPDRFNFSDLITGGGSDTPGSLPGFRVSDILIGDGSLIFDDRVAGRIHRVDRFRFALPLISSFPEDAQRDIQPAVSATVNGAALSVSGDLRVFTADRRALIKIDLSDLNVLPYLPYVPSLPPTLVQAGALHADTLVSYGDKAGKPAYLSATGEIALTGWRIADAAGRQVLDLPRLDLTLAPSNLLARQVRLEKIACPGAVLDVARDDKGRFNVLSLVPGSEQPATGQNAAPDPRPFSLVVDAVRLTDARVTFSDRSPAEPFRTVMWPVNLAVDRFNLTGDSLTAVAFSIRTESGEAADLTGEFSLKPLGVRGTLKWSDIRPGKYAAYIQDRVRFAIADGAVGGQTTFQVDLDGQTPVVKVADTGVSVRALKITDPSGKETLLAVPALTVSGAAADLSERTLAVDALATEKGAVLCRREPDGQLNFQKLLVETPAADAAPAAETGQPTEKPWRITAGLSLTDYTVVFEDQATPEPVRIELDRIAVKAQPLTTSPHAPSRVSATLRFNKKGQIAIDGPVTIGDQTARLAVNAADIDIRALQPYFTDKLRVTVIDGDFGVKGIAELGPGPSGKTALSFTGETQVNRFASMDKKEARDFVKWGSLYIGETRLRTDPLTVHIDKVALSDYFTGLIIHPDGTVNINTVFAWNGSDTTRAPAATDPAAATHPASPAPDIQVGTIIIQNGTLRFTDLLTRPNFKTEFQRLGGTVSGLSSAKEVRAQVLLEGVQENSAPLKIQGTVHPFGADRFVDMNVVFKEIELSPFSAYTGRYLGYLLEKGKLHLDLAYEMQGNRLKGKNLVVLDQLTLGERVESPDATSLPVAFAIALLKDRNGRIELDLPVAGDISDPEFKIGKIVLRVLVNLVTKIITSPFAALGAVFGGGEELSFVAFAPGSTDLTDAATEKLATLAKALDQRPALQLEIRGEIDPGADAENLRNQRFELLLKAERRKEMVAGGQTVDDLAAVEIPPEAFPVVLKMAYDASDMPKPRDSQGKEKTLPPEEMKKLLMAGIRVEADDLRTLAHERASSVKERLIADGGVDPARIFIVEPHADFTAAGGKHRKPQVNFTLK